MVLRMTVSPDAEGRIRIKCGDVEIELDVVSPATGLRPIYPSNPADGTTVAFSIGPQEELRWRGLQESIASGSRLMIADYDLTKFEAQGENLETLAEGFAPPSGDADLMRIEASVLDVHAVERMMARFGDGAPKLLLDLHPVQIAQTA